MSLTSGWFTILIWNVETTCGIYYIYDTLLVRLQKDRERADLISELRMPIGTRTAKVSITTKDTV